MKYIAIKAVQLPTGTLVKFGEEKAARFAAQLAKGKGGRYECLVPVWVKAGEIIDLEDPAKHVLACLQAQSGKPAAPEKVFAPAVKPDTSQPAAAPAPESSGAGNEDSANAAPKNAGPAAE